MDSKVFSAMYICLLSLVQSLPIRPLAGTNVSEISVKTFEAVNGRYLSVQRRKKRNRKKIFEKYLRVRIHEYNDDERKERK